MVYSFTGKTVLSNCKQITPQPNPTKLDLTRDIDLFEKFLRQGKEYNRLGIGKEHVWQDGSNLWSQSVTCFVQSISSKRKMEASV